MPQVPVTTFARIATQYAIRVGLVSAAGRGIIAFDAGAFDRRQLGTRAGFKATTPEKDTLGYKIASRFRRPLTAAEYRRLTSVIVRIRAVHHSWSVLAYNCNDFVADVARGTIL